MFLIKMLNKKEFAQIKKELEIEEQQRESIIQLSREIINLSKKIIYSLHRNDTKSAAQYVYDIENKKNALDKKNIQLDTNINNTAYQEYVEALSYFYLEKKNQLPTKKTLKVSSELYLMGLCDLTGELIRKAVNEAINKKIIQVIKIKNLVEEIYGEFLKFDLRNSELRKKSDSIKWNLQKLEDLVFQLKIIGK